MCGLDKREVAHVFAAPPLGEVRFPFEGEYRRELLRCEVCGHVVSAHAMDMSSLYEGAYVDATYGADGMRRSFERVSALPPSQSDNAGRVACILEHAERHGLGKPRLLDVGSGTGVFPHRIAAHGWDVVALDPDRRAVAHLTEVAQVKAELGDFVTMPVEHLGRFGLVTLNKVLEHVVEPIEMLSRAHDVLAEGAQVYIELPDAEAASAESWAREEFFVDHHHVFTVTSMSLLSSRAGFRVLRIDRLREPSGKYTLRAFLAAAP